PERQRVASVSFRFFGRIYRIIGFFSRVLLLLLPSFNLSERVLSIPSCLQIAEIVPAFKSFGFNPEWLFLFL
ncbi:MAG: hypothetical protein U9R43_10540, partial [Thermodesulfobacteriota bacterium]|nr:hypothetical protein [Thermodesulfobacteriota bacterium]